MSDADFWKNRKLADQKIKEVGELNDLIKKFDEIEKLIEECSADFSIGTGRPSAPAAEGDLRSHSADSAARRPSSAEFRELPYEKSAEQKLNHIITKLRQLEVERLFTGKYDKQSAILSIFAGAGGQDAEDWVGMLYEMYVKFAGHLSPEGSRQVGSYGAGWKTKIIHETLGDFQSKTGRHPVKDITFEIKGDYAYGYLKNESGVHRLVRISPFSPEKKRHTSFALAEVLPELPEREKEEIKVPEEDLKVDFFRSSGPGGQNVNKVETAVRIHHLPTGITASSQAERSQSQNRERALRILTAKLIKLMEEKQIRELDKLKVKVKPEWGNQIRSYVLNPYKLVKDHRTGVETTQVDKVLDGELDLFIESDIMR